INNLLIMSSFDFHSELNVNILGHIFEQSLTDLEEIKGSEGGIPKRKKEGIYYTERYITEYICKNTIIPYLSLKGTNDVYQLIDEYSKNIDALEKRFREIKILDPACGSGAFLLQAVDTLLDVHREITRFKEAKGRYVTTKKGKKTTAEVFTLSKWSEEEEARKIIENNIFGVDLNEESVEITKLSLFLKIASTNRKLIDLSQNIKTGNSIIDDKSITEKGFVWEKEFPDIFKKGGFDIVIGNPPYGRYGTLSDEQKTYLKEKNYLGDTADISESFILAAGERFVKQDGFFGFIIPKGLSYVVSWGKTRQHILDNFNMIRLADASEAFPEVLYEQMIFVLRKENKRNDLIELSIIRPDSLETTTLERTYFTKRIFPIGLSCDKIPILKKIQKNCIPLREGLMDYWYGKGGMTPLVNKEGKGVKLLTGKEIARFGFNLDIEPWYLKEENLNETDKKRTSVDKVVVQDIVAHITKPKPHIMITAALDKEKRFCLNTVMCFAENGKGCSNEMLLAVLNSKFMSFYYYYFVFNQAVRTMHFMPGYSDYIPIPRNYKQYEPRLVEKCRQMIALTDNYNILKAKFINRAKDNIG
ncbi:MAG: N-6 DNA methylase, partial [Nitrososphaera sp.]